MVSSTDLRTLRRLRAAFPDLRLGLSTGHWATSAPTPAARILVRTALRLLLPRLLPPLMRLAGATDAVLHHHLATTTVVARFHARGLRVNAWTPNDAADIERVVAAGIDSLTSDRPDLARRIAIGATPSER